MRDIPIAVILEWPIADYNNPVTRGPSAPIMIAILSSFAVIAVGLRVYTRLFVQQWPGYDDWLLILAVTTTLALNSTVGYAIVHYGWARHVYDIPPRLLAASGMIVFISKLLFQVAITFLRLSILSFYYRLVHDSGKHRFRTALHCTVVFVIALFIVGACIGIFVCVPIHDYWAFPPDPNRKCFDEGPIGFVVALVNCLADLLITCLPIPLVLQLNLPTRSKVGVLFGFCLGFIVSIAAGLRTYYWYQANIVSYDVTWEAYPLWIASAVEVNIGMICACAPAIRVLVQKKFIPALSQLSKSTNSRSDSMSGERSKRRSKIWSYVNPRNSLGRNYVSPNPEETQRIWTLNAFARPFSSSQRMLKNSDPIPLSHNSLSDHSMTLSPSSPWPVKTFDRTSSSTQLENYKRDQERFDTRQPNLWRESIVTSPTNSWRAKSSEEKNSLSMQLDVHGQDRARRHTRQSSSLTKARLQAKLPPLPALSASSSIHSSVEPEQGLHPWSDGSSR